MPAQPIPIDDDVRLLSERGLSTRQQARQLHVGQSTIIRAQQRINTGPNPILPPGYKPRRRWPKVPGIAAVAVALILLAAVAVVLLMARTIRDGSTPQQVQVCVRYDPKTGDVAGIAAGGGCPPGWQSVTLTPAG